MGLKRLFKDALRALSRHNSPDQIKNRRFYYGRKAKKEDKKAHTPGKGEQKGKNDARSSLQSQCSGT